MEFLFMFLEDFCKLNKTPSNGTCWDFILTGGFYVSRLFSMPPALEPGFSRPWTPPPVLSSTLAIFGFFTFARFFRHIFTASATVLSKYFLPTGVFHLPLLPHISARFVTQMRAGTPHPGSFSVDALTELFLPAAAWPWTTQIVGTRPLVYRLRQ